MKGLHEIGRLTRPGGKGQKKSVKFNQSILYYRYRSVFQRAEGPSLIYFGKREKREKDKELERMKRRKLSHQNQMTPKGAGKGYLGKTLAKPLEKQQIGIY